MIKLLCKICSKEFLVYNYRKNSANFCSYKCYWKYLSTLPGFRKDIKWSKKMKKRMSKIAKGQHRSPQTEFKKGHKLGGGFKKGRIPWNKGKKCPKFSGKNNPNWKSPKDRTTPLQKQVRKSYQFKVWREEIFARDNYTCQECFQKGNELHPHHKKLFSIIWKENNIKTFEQALACKELWDIDNGITLCFYCHKKIHNFKYIYRCQC